MKRYIVAFLLSIIISITTVITLIFGYGEQQKHQYLCEKLFQNPSPPLVVRAIPAWAVIGPLTQGIKPMRNPYCLVGAPAVDLFFLLISPEVPPSENDG